jgi:membrane-bound lytic murein transglycosylase D
MPNCLRLKIACLFLLLSACTSNPSKVSTSAREEISQKPESSAPVKQQTVIRSSSTIRQSPDKPETKTLNTIKVYDDVWTRIQDKLVLERHLHRSQVQEKIAWYKRNQDYIDRVVDRARPYLYYIVEQIEARQMPVDLALLPVIESAFHPFAYSPARASGIWQFMPRTGLHYGLKQNWWYDGRRDITAATNAALDYLEKLAGDFNNDWLLVVAAYNSGEGNVARAIRQNKKAGKPTDFFSLRLPRETRGYVPSLLAVAEIIGNSHKHQIKLDTISNKPYFAQIDIGSQIDLALVADLSALTMDEIYTLNPGFNRWATDPQGPHEILVPVNKAESLTSKLAQIPSEERISWTRHIIQQGESLGVIANRYHTDINTLKKANNIRSNLIRTGHSLLVPSSKQPAKFYTMSQDSRRFRGLSRADGNKFIYTVRNGDNLWDISRQYGVSVKNLTDWNGISSKGYLQPKQKLTLWLEEQENNHNSDSTKVTSTTKPSGDINYTVRTGDSLWLIARRFDTHVNSIKNWNNLSHTSLIKPGQVLTIKDSNTILSGSSVVAAQKSYIVRRGDSLWLIARRFNITVAKLKAWNNLPDDQHLQPGQTLILHPQEA